jgi:hypothetical protein
LLGFDGYVKNFLKSIGLDWSVELPRGWSGVHVLIGL